MKTKTKLFSILTVIALFLGLTISGFARPGRGRGMRRRGHGRMHRHHRRGPGHMFVRALANPEIRKKAGISEAKAKRIFNLLLNTKKRIIPLKAKIRVNRISIKQEFMKKNVSNARIKSLLKSSHDTKWKIISLRMSTRIRITKILTYKQRTALRKVLMERFKRKHFKRRGPRRGRRGFGNRNRGRYTPEGR